MGFLPLANEAEILPNDMYIVAGSLVRYLT